MAARQTFQGVSRPERERAAFQRPALGGLRRIVEMRRTIMKRSLLFVCVFFGLVPTAAVLAATVCVYASINDQRGTWSVRCLHGAIGVGWEGTPTWAEEGTFVRCSWTPGVTDFFGLPSRAAWSGTFVWIPAWPLALLLGAQALVVGNGVIHRADPDPSP